MTLPPLPTGHTIGCGIFNGEKLFTADQMRAYGEVCAAAEREACAKLCEAEDPHGAYDHREVAGVEVLPYAPTYTEQQIADACMAAEVPDSKCESVLLALRA